MRLFWLVLVLVFGVFACPAETDCTGADVFQPRKCAGDELSAGERELIRLINEYRGQNKLPAIPVSDALNFVANRHLIDITENLRTLTHSWSDCVYDLGDQKSWNCVLGSPTRLKTDYKGDGFENLFHSASGAATPADALAAWKKSPHHNGLILNLDSWKAIGYDALGVALRGSYAAIWFGAPRGGGVNLGREIKGLGITYEKLVDGLTGTLRIEKESSVGESQKWTGLSADKSIRLEIYGREKDIAETSVGITAKLGSRTQLNPESRDTIRRFLANIAPNWFGRDKWFDDSLRKLLRNRRVPQRINIENKTFEMNIGADNVFSLTARPNPRVQAIEL